MINFGVLPGGTREDGIDFPVLAAVDGEVRTVAGDKARNVLRVLREVAEGRLKDEFSRQLDSEYRAAREFELPEPSGPGPKNPARDLQMLNELAEAMLAVVDSSEIELMVVRDRVVVSANETSAVRDLGGYSLAEVLDKAAAQKLDEATGQKVAKLRAVRAALTGEHDETGTKRLASLAVDCHLWPLQADSVRGLLRTLADAGRPIVSVGAPADAATLITDDAYAGRVIAVEGFERSGTHADQNLALALALSRHRGPASVAGGKRSCTMCYLSLSALLEHGWGRLRFNPQPGGFPEGMTLDGLHRIAVALGISTQRMMEQVEAEGF